MNLESTLRAARDGGAKLLVPYVTGGLGRGWLDVVRAVAAAGADAIEVGIPFSDPVMDGRTIQEASQRALDIARPYRTGQPIGGAVDGIQQFVFLMKTEGAQHRTKHLFLFDPHTGLDLSEQCRRHEMAGAAQVFSGQQGLRAFVRAEFNVA